MPNTEPQGLDLAGMTASQVIEQFGDVLTYAEAQEILDFDLDGPDTLAMIYAALNDRIGDRKLSQMQLDALMASFDPTQSV